MAEKTIHFERDELSWLYTRIVAASEHAEKIINSLTGPVNIRTDEQEKMLAEARKFKDSNRHLITAAEATLTAGDTNRHRLRDFRVEMETARLYVEEPDAIAELDKRLAELPDHEPYRVVFDTESMEHILQMVERDIHQYTQVAIPNCEKTNACDYTDAIMKKSYYVNKLKAEKAILENLQKKLIAGMR